MTTKRRFYAFNSPEAVEEHISQIKTVTDVLQLRFDVAASGCNLVKFQTGIPGVWALDYAKGEGLFCRHIFISSGLRITVTPTAEYCDRYTYLED